MPQTTDDIKVNFYEPGNVVVHACHLIHNDNEIIDLSGGLNQFVVKYDLKNVSASCKVSVLDTTNILGNMNLDGSESIKLSWNSDEDDIITGEFGIYRKDVDVDRSQGAKGKIFTLYGLDTTNLKQMSLDINRAFTGNISDHVKSIFKNINSNHQIEVDKTAGTSTIIIPGETPFEAINRLTNLAFSTTHPSSLFNFYQSKKGYNFKNIEKLIADNRDDCWTYRYTPTGLTGDGKTMEEKYTISAIEFPTKKSLISKLSRGTYASSVSEIDIINQKIDSTHFNVQENFNDFYHLDQPAISNDKQKVIEESLKISNTTKWINKYFDGSRHLDFKLGSQISKRRFYAGSLDENEMNCTIHGNSNIDCGDILYLSMLEMAGASETPEQEKIISGKYLISSVTHIIQTGTYACNLKCNKESGRANVTDIENYIVGDR